MRIFLQRMTAACLLAAGVLFGPAETASASRPIAVYGNLPGYEMAALSPSGERVALVGVAADARRLIVLDKDGEPLLAIPLGDQKLRTINWAGEDLVLLHYSQTVNLGMDFVAEKAELSTMLVVPVKGGKPWSVFAGDRTITGGIRGFYGAIEREGRWYGYFGGITLTENGRSETFLGDTNPELYEVDLQTRRATRIARRISQDNLRTWLIGPDGKIAATLDFVPQSGGWKIGNGGGKIVASGRSPRGGIDLISLGRTAGTMVYSVEDEATGEDRWFEMPLAGGDATEILKDEQVGGNFI
ncbi:MAG: peptidase prolyl oligopeptidase, partial [Sphingomonas bacterium]|nr:peptidase prolyl oligopeptidase [Sphingomonas bacterium]